MNSAMYGVMMLSCHDIVIRTACEKLGGQHTSSQKLGSSASNSQIDSSEVN